MSNKRIEALNSLDRNNYNSKYVTLSDNTKIGADLIKDLIKYFQLEFKNKYRYNYRRWILENIGSEEICTDDDVPSEPVVQVVPGNPVVPGDKGVQGGGSNCDDDVETMNKIIYKIIEGEGDDGIAINRLKKYIQKKYIQKKYNENPEDSDDIEIPDDIFNGDIGLRKNYRDSSINYGYIPVIRISDKDGSLVYFKPLLEYNYTNYDFQEKSQIYDDLNKLNGIFKKSNYKDIDDLVILDFYKDFTKKVEKLKDDIISRDDDVKYDLIDNIYDKLAIIYEIKIGRNKKVLKKPIKEILEADKSVPKKTPKDICDIDNKNLFNQILCEINKRAQIFNNLTTLKKGGKKARKEGGGGEGEGGANKVVDGEEVKKLGNIIDKLADATAGDKTQRYKAYLEIDKNILAGFINETKIEEYITKLQNSKSLTKLSKITELFFKTPKKINGKIDKSNISFAAFNKFIEKIKDRMIDDSNRYLAIIKSLNIIMKKALGGSPSTNTERPQIVEIPIATPAAQTPAKIKDEEIAAAIETIQKALAKTAEAIEAVKTAEAIEAVNTAATVASAAETVPATVQATVPATVPAKEAVNKAVNASEEVVKTIAIEKTKIADVSNAVTLVKEKANMEGTELKTALDVLKTALEALKTALEALKTSPEISGGAYQKEVSGNIRNQGNQGNQGNQKQGIGDKMPGNPGKEYLKNLTEIYINLAKEYGKFIKDESEIKKLIKLVIKSQEDIEKSSIDIQGEQSDAESLKAKIEEINKEYELRDKEQKSIEKGKNKVIGLANKKVVDGENNTEKVNLKDDIQTEVETYNIIFTALTDIKNSLIKLLKDKEKGKEVVKDKEEEFKKKKTELQAKEEEINKLIKNYRVKFGSGDNELASEETKKELEELENQNKENEKKSKNLEERKKQLTASLKVIKDELRKLYKACIDINLPYATEYNDFVKNIIKVGQLKYIIDDNPQINNNNEIIEVYNKEIDRIDKELGDIKIDITSNAKKINDKKEITKSQGQGRNNRPYPGGALYRGGTKEDDEEKSRLKPLLDGNLYKLITNDKLVGDNNLFAFISELKSVFDNDDDNDVGQDNASGKRYNDKETLYEQIWNDYSDGVKAYYNNQKDKNPLTYINEGEKLKNKVILYDLDPEIVLKITFQDKVVFLALMFAIRTMIMVLFEFLIDYNIVKSLRYAILIYAAVYILILLLFTAFVNLDSYKLRIVFNYLNMHINTPGIILHIMLFIIFSLLVIIIIQTDNFINNLGDILDYTYIYNYIYTFNFDKILSGEFENNLTKDEKIKLQYRLDIISMLIFIFSGTLILLM